VIWIERQGTAPTARAGRGLCCHWSPAWLRANGELEAKAGGVEIMNPSDFLTWRRDQPYMLFHELAHAYHWQIGGLDQKIKDAFRAARERGLYEAVPRNSVGLDAPVRAYAATNDHEYFAELSEAYFALNDFFPFTRAQLASYDSEGLAMIERMWNLSETDIADAFVERP
jgi:hypothetical protein